MVSRRLFPTCVALVAMLFSVSQPAWGICVGCSRSRNVRQAVSVERHSTVERDVLFAGRVRGAVFGGRPRIIFHRASYGGGSSGGQGRYEASCGQSAAEAGCGTSSQAPADDMGSTNYDVDDLSAQVPSRPIAWKVEAIELPRPAVRWRVHEIVKLDRPAAPVVAIDTHRSQ